MHLLIAFQILPKFEIVGDGVDDAISALLLLPDGL